MKPKITKVIFDNEEVLELGEVAPITPEDYKDWKKRINWERQFEQFEKQILGNLDEDIIKDYAKDWLDLKDEDDCDCDDNDCDCDDISEVSDLELIKEVYSRITKQRTADIITADLFFRFTKVLQFADKFEIDKILSEQEQKFKIS
jgi:hypothetical protein